MLRVISTSHVPTNSCRNKWHAAKLVDHATSSSVPKPSLLPKHSAAADNKGNVRGTVVPTHAVTGPSRLAPAVMAALGAACFLLAKQCQTVGFVKTASSPTRLVLKPTPWTTLRLLALCVPLLFSRAPGINIVCTYTPVLLPA
ncbi:hypothetical protein ACJQWK_08888 [Exserohilum turcicum]